MVLGILVYIIIVIVIIQFFFITLLGIDYAADLTYAKEILLN